MVSFNNPIIQYLVIPAGATTGTRIVLDGVDGFLEVFDSNNTLIASIAGRDGTDPNGNVVHKGVSSYDTGGGASNGTVDIQLSTGGINFLGRAGTVLTLQAALFAQYPTTSTGIPFIELQGPNSNSTAPAPQMTVSGVNQAGTNRPTFGFGPSNGSPSAMDFNINGTLQLNNVISYTGGGVNGWQKCNYNGGAAFWVDGPFGGVFAFLDADGWVNFKGMIQSSSGPYTAPVNAFQVPFTAFLPNRTINLAGQNSPAPAVNPFTCSFQIGATGQMLITNFSGSFASGTIFSFENVRYSLT